MYLANSVAATARPLCEYERQFALCESCFWCATIFQKIDIHRSNNYSLQQQQKICPLCKNKSISLVPLAKDEEYAIAIEGKRGIERVLKTSKMNTCLSLSLPKLLHASFFLYLHPPALATQALLFINSPR